ncbi:MAG: DUF4340 domain-containing protein [Planctomycetes bacterium]|nr:DUF4340 domain-containing protein [Planctomycetota bacterium]
MSSRSVMVLVLLAVLAGGAAWLAGGDGAAPATEGVGQPLLPGLKARLNDVAALGVLTATERFTVRLSESGTWTMDESDGYPVRFETVKKTLMALAGLTTVEAKTDNPTRYADLGVADPEAPESGSTLVTLLDAQGQSLGAVIVGNPGGARDTHYARRASEARSWLVRGNLVLDRSPAQWMDRQVFKLPSSRVQSVTIEHADGEKVMVSRAAESEPDWAVQAVPEGSEPRSSGIGRTCASALEYLNFDKVAGAGKQPIPEAERATAVLRAFDGLLVSVTTGRAPAAEPAEGETAVPGTVWASLTVSAGEDAAEAVKAEARTANDALAPWVFALPEYAAGNLRKRMADLVQPIAAQPAEGALPELTGWPEGEEASGLDEIELDPAGDVPPQDDGQP